MQIEAGFRRRASVVENNIDLNDKTIKALSAVKGFWKDGCAVSDVYFESGEESAAADLSPSLVSGFKGAISYASRLPKAIFDKAMCDDFITIQFDTDVVDYKNFCHNIFPKIVEIFGAYRATVITDMDLELDDWEKIQEEFQITGKSIGGRNSVFRFHATNYYDDELCRRAFGMGASEVVARLSGKIILADNLQSGAFLIITDEPVAGEKLIAMDSKIRQELS